MSYHTPRRQGLAARSWVAPASSQGSLTGKAAPSPPLPFQVCIKPLPRAGDTTMNKTWCLAQKMTAHQNEGSEERYSPVWGAQRRKHPSYNQKCAPSGPDPPALHSPHRHALLAMRELADRTRLRPFRVFQPTGGGVQPQLCGLRRPVSYSHSKAGALQTQLPFVSHITVGGQFSTTLHAGGGPGGGKDNRGS